MGPLVVGQAQNFVTGSGGFGRVSVTGGRLKIGEDANIGFTSAVGSENRLALAGNGDVTVGGSLLVGDGAAGAGFLDVTEGSELEVTGDTILGRGSFGDALVRQG